MMSLEELTQKIHDAIRGKYGNGKDGYSRYCVIETFPSYVIAREYDTGDLFRFNYSVGQDDVVVIDGDPQPVETAYLPVAESCGHFAMTSEAAAGTTDETWPVVVMKAGWGFGKVTLASGQAPLPQYFPPEVVAKVAASVNGSRFGRRHPETQVEEQDPARVAGWLDRGSFASAEGEALAYVNLFPTETEIKGKLAAARDANKLDLFGVSVLGYFGFKKGKVEGRECLFATDFAKLTSVDFCAEAAAGGRFLTAARVAASQHIPVEIAQLQAAAVRTSSPAGNGGNNPGGASGAGRTEEGEAMKSRILMVLTALAAFDAAGATTLTTEFSALSEDKHEEFLGKVTEALAKVVKPATQTADADALAQARQVLADAQKLDAKNRIEGKLAASKLPVPGQNLVRDYFVDRMPTDAEIDTKITAVRTELAALATITRVGATGVEVGRESVEKVQLACDAMLGVKTALADANVRPFRGLQEAYIIITGDRDFRALGAGNGFYKVSEAISTADFPNILLNSMTKKLLQDYAEVGMGGLEQLYVVTPGGIPDFKTQDRVRMGYLGDLPTVAEAGPYTELTKPTDEKVSFTMAKKGGILTISEETIRNDDLSKIAQFPSRLARAARRTLKQVITDILVNNPNFGGDGVALFHAGHSNLSAVALSAAELDARAIALAKQAEKDSNKRLGLRLNWIAVPVDLEPTARQINRNDSGTNNWFQKFGANDERIIVNELFTDANDWYYGAPVADAPSIEVGFLDNQQAPTILLANDPRTGTQFTNDQLQYKVRFVFGAVATDYRGVGKAVVA
ncbi:MAG TPA: hypothetical protein VN577_20015 [Terriglobales bacterium]|nr:hypothetical protein [Terriglobales bacterium]